MMLGISIFAINSKLVPQYFGKTYAYGELYAPFGASLVSLALAPFLQPLAFFGRLFSLSRIKFFFGTITGFAGLPLLAPAALLAALPGYLMLLSQMVITASRLATTMPLSRWSACFSHCRPRSTLHSPEM